MPPTAWTGRAGLGRAILLLRRDRLMMAPERTGFEGAAGPAAQIPVRQRAGNWPADLIADGQAVAVLAFLEDCRNGTYA